MILSRSEILKQIKQKQIIIDPFSENCLGINSYDVHLGESIATYRDTLLDSCKYNPVDRCLIPDDGMVLMPSKLYLGVTKEYTETWKYVPFLEGKSSLGRLGMNIHVTAGKGDIGYCNYWTLEITVVHPLRVYKDMPIGQLIYFEVSGTIDLNYQQHHNSKYRSKDSEPVESKMFHNFVPKSL